MLISNERLRYILGGLWLLDGLLQLQPGMFTMNLVTGIMIPNLQGQPAPVTASLTWIIQIVSQHLTLFNWMIALIQIALGICLVTGYRMRAVLITSVIWALVVWYAGEGMGLILTGQATALTGAPGAVLLYALLALVLYPHQKPHVAVTSTAREIPTQGVPIESTNRGSLEINCDRRWQDSGCWPLSYSCSRIGGNRNTSRRRFRGLKAPVRSATCS